MANGSPRVSVESNGPQVVDVTVDGGYRPAVIHARAGLPLRLAFLRLDTSECAERVVFSTPRLERHLALAGTTVVDLPAQPPGVVRFTCGMGRFIGRIEFTDGPSNLIRRMERNLGQLTPLGPAHLLWIAALPLLALLAPVMLDPGPAFAVASLALAVWVAGCVWAFGRNELRLR